MSAKYSQHFKTKEVPQTEPTPGRNEVENNAGGFVYGIDDMSRLDRFLILGTEGGTYYSTERKLTQESGQCVQRLLQAGKGLEVIKRVVEISDGGRASSNDPALFVLAICSGNLAPVEVRKAAMEVLPKVARIGTHLFHFAEMVQGFRGWGKLLRSGVANWYTEKGATSLLYDAIKYRQRDGWSHRDLLRLSHPQTDDANLKQVFNWICKGEQNKDLPHLDRLDIAAKVITADDGGMSNTEIAAAIREHNLPREVIPTTRLNDKEVWQALLDNMPMGALLRNINKLTSIDVLKPMSTNVAKAVAEITDPERIKKARLHPYQILLARLVYANGKGVKGSMTWEPVPAIIDALEDAFYKSFDLVEPTGKRILMGVDVSGSMDCSIAGGWETGIISCRDVAAADGDDCGKN